MKRKFAAIVAGITLLTGGVVTAMSSVPMAQAQIMPAAAQLPMVQTFISELNLTPDQLQQLAVVRRSTRSQIEAVLTPEQKPYAQAAFSAAQDIRKNLAELNLTQKQRQDIRGILQSSRSELQGLLTQEQRDIIRDKVRARFQNFNGGRFRNR